jgi:hypothetical protein
MRSDQLRLPRHSHEGAEAWRRALRAWWFDLPAALRTPWPTALAAVTILALLLGFHQVVEESVRQGELLRMNTATRSQAVWRCNALNSVRKRADCMSQLNAPQQQHANAPPPPNTAALRVTQAGG